MSYPVHHVIFQGETLEFELRVVGEDVSSATVRIETSAGMPSVNFTSAKTAIDTVQVKAVATGEFSRGIHTLKVWLDWPSGDILSEVINESKVHVLDSSNFSDIGSGIIDGGIAETVHADELSGGGA